MIGVVTFAPVRSACGEILCPGLSHQHARPLLGGGASLAFRHGRRLGSHLGTLQLPGIHALVDLSLQFTGLGASLLDAPVRGASDGDADALALVNPLKDV